MHETVQKIWPTDDTSSTVPAQCDPIAPTKIGCTPSPAKASSGLPLAALGMANTTQSRRR
jgi:hypothetical protein